MSYEMYPGNLYSYTAGVYLGVLMKESVVKKLAKLQASYLEQVKRLIAAENEKGNIFHEGWTLHYPGGKQTTVIYIDKSPFRNMEEAIKYATTADQPRCHFPIFIAESMNQAKEMADKRFEELNLPSVDEYPAA